MYSGVGSIKVKRFSWREKEQKPDGKREISWFIYGCGSQFI